MSAVIKLGSAQQARTVTPYAAEVATEVAARVAEAPSSDPCQDELNRLHALLAERDAACEALKAQVAKARAEGETAGRAAAELDAEECREKALALLRRGIEQAQLTLADGRDRMEALALLVARTALDKLFGDDRGRKEAVSALVMHQLQSVERQMLLKIEVSPLDFPDTPDLATLADQIGAVEALVSANAELPAGGCRMQLRVGVLEVGLDQQWGAVRDLLDRLAVTAEAQP